MDAYAKLFEDKQFYKRVMSEMTKVMYLNYRNTIAMQYELPQDTGYAVAAEPEVCGTIAELLRNYAYLVPHAIYLIINQLRWFAEERNFVYNSMVPDFFDVLSEKNKSAVLWVLKPGFMTLGTAL